MHAITILHRILSASCPKIHAKRLASLLAAVEAVVSGSPVGCAEVFLRRIARVEFSSNSRKEFMLKKCRQTCEATR